jgi:hypothetical protein
VSLSEIEVVGIEGHEAELDAIIAACKGLLRSWGMADVEVRRCPLLMPTGRSASEVDQIAEHYRVRQTPGLLLVCNGLPYRPGREADEVYTAVHDRLGNDLGLLVKPVQIGSKDWTQKILNTLPGALARHRQGLVPWGLAEELPYDLSFGVDIGGRDRGSGRGNEWLLGCAVAGDDNPIIWTPDTAEIITTETLREEQLAGIVLAGAKKLKGKYRRNWLYLRDGSMSDEERAALQRIGAQAQREKLLPADQVFVAVEIKKDHGLRLFKTGAIWQQPDTGIFWDRRHSAEFVLTTTGAPWNIQGSADPLCCRIILLAGDKKNVKPRGLIRTLYWLTHLNYSAPKNFCRLPLPLHLAQKLGEVLSKGRTLRMLPF